MLLAADTGTRRGCGSIAGLLLVFLKLGLRKLVASLPLAMLAAQSVGHFGSVMIPPARLELVS
jgi:hypothetical protein